MIGVDMTIEAEAVVNKCAEAGLLICTAGKKVLRFLPPLVIDKGHIDSMIGILDKVLGEVEGGA